MVKGTKHLNIEHIQIYQVNKSYVGNRISGEKDITFPYPVPMRNGDDINYNGGSINTTFDIFTPNNFVTSVSNTALFSGLDAFVLCEILIKLNATPKYYNKKISAFMKGVNNTVIDNSDIRYLLNIAHDGPSYLVFDKRMIEYLHVGYSEPLIPELKFSSVYVVPNDHMDFLYPHDDACVVVICPRQARASAFMKQLIYSLEAQLFVCSLSIFWIGRIIIRKSPLKDWFSIYFSTVSVYLVQNKITKTKNVMEHFWILTLMVFSHFTIALLSAFIYSNLISNPHSEALNTLNDLVSSKMKILVSHDLKNTLETWQANLRPEIFEKISYIPVATIIKTIDFNSDFDDYDYFADEISYDLPKETSMCFVLPKEQAAFMLSVYDDRNEFYIMRQPLQCGLISYQIAKNSPNKVLVDGIIRGMVENGLIGIYKTWTKFLWKRQTELFRNHSIVLTFDQISGIIYTYLIGISFSLFGFLCELLVGFVEKKFTKQ